MSFQFNTSAELLEQMSQKGLYPKLLKQLHKDFLRANVEFPSETNMLPEELIGFLREKLYVLLLERFQDFLNLMYAVDVSESDFATIQAMDMVEAAEKSGLLVLRRESQKVLLKAKYS